MPHGSSAYAHTHRCVCAHTNTPVCCCCAPASPVTRTSRLLMSTLSPGITPKPCSRDHQAHTCTHSQVADVCIGIRGIPPNSYRHNHHGTLGQYSNARAVGSRREYPLVAASTAPAPCCQQSLLAQPKACRLAAASYPQPAARSSPQKQRGVNTLCL